MADINLGVGGANSAVGGYDIANSLKMESDNTEYLSQTIGAGSRTTATYSFWFKRTELGADMQIAGISPIGSETVRFLITSGDVLDVETGVGGDNNSLVTNRKFRDTSAWYHFVVAIDTTQATEANRVKVYVNGVQETSFSFSEYPAQNTDLTIGVSGYTWRYGAYDNTYNKSSGYLAEAYYIDAQQLDPTSFGEFDEDTGIWKPIAYTGSFGSNGHYLDFSDASNLGNNLSGVGNDFTLNNITSADQATDTPTNNFATFNTIKRYNQGTMSFQNGGTEVTVSGGGFWTTVFTSMAINKGKWYWEGQVRVTNGTTMWGCTPVGQTEININTDWYLGQSANGQAGVGFYDNDDGYYHNATFTACTISGSTFNTQTGDIIMIGVDMDNNKIYAGVNGNWCNSSDNTLPNATGITIVDELTYFAMAVFNAATHKANFGGYTTISISTPASDANGYGNFEYAPPSGYYALCSKNLAEFG